MEDIKAALAALAERQGIEMAFDENGACALPLVGDRFLQVQIRDNVQDVVFVATLGSVPAKVRGAVFQVLLSANYYWMDTVGATLSWHDRLEQVLLSYAVPWTADEATLETAFVRFLELQEAWSKRLADDVEEAEGAFREAEATEGGETLSACFRV